MATWRKQPIKSEGEREEGVWRRPESLHACLLLVDQQSQSRTASSANQPTNNADSSWMLGGAHSFLLPLLLLSAAAPPKTDDHCFSFLHNRSCDKLCSLGWPLSTQYSDDQDMCCIIGSI